MRLYRVLLYFLQTALHVSDNTLIHHQEHIQTLIASGIGPTVFATVFWRGVVGTTVPTDSSDYSTSAYGSKYGSNSARYFNYSLNVRLMMDEGSSETCRTVCRKYIVASCWTIIDMENMSLPEMEKEKNFKNVVTFYQKVAHDCPVKTETLYYTIFTNLNLDLKRFRTLTRNTINQLKNCLILKKLLGRCRVHSQTTALSYFKRPIKIYIKMHLNIAPTFFGLRPSSGSLHWTWLKLYLC